MKTAIIKTQIWEDDTIFGLNLDTKLLYFFLTTAPPRNTTRFYKCADRVISAYIGISDKALELCKQQLSQLGLIYFLEGWVIIGDNAFVQPSKGKLSQTIYEQDLENVPANVKELARMKKLSTGKSSGAAPEYKNKNKDKSKEKTNLISGVEWMRKEEVFELDEKGDAKFKRTSETR